MKQLIYTCLCLALLSAPAIAVALDSLESTDEAISTPTAQQPQSGLVLFGADFQPFCPTQPPLEGNAAAYYVKAFDLWTSRSKHLNAKIRNSPTLLEQRPFVIRAVDLLEEGTQRKDCDFYEFYDFSVSAYFQQRPSSVSTLMLAKLIFRRAQRDSAAGRHQSALRHAKSGIIFAVHLYQTAETHTQATTSIHILSAALALCRNIYQAMGQPEQARAANAIHEQFRGLMDDHVKLRTSLRHGLPRDLDSVLEALGNPLPAVRCEGLRVLGNVIDPRVSASYLADPNYNILRQRVIRLRPRVIRLLKAMTADPDPRAARLAGELHRLMTEPPPPPSNTRTTDAVTTMSIPWWNVEQQRRDKPKPDPSRK
ncbi:hypothetical protein ACFL34_02290 [Candidatus Sumerlaeota bacterium]